MSQLGSGRIPLLDMLQTNNWRARSFRSYVEYLESLLRGTVCWKEFSKDSRIAAALDGEPSFHVRELFSARNLKRTAAFFTGQALADRALKYVFGNLTHLPVIDPSCGAGDLLVACAKKLPLKPGLQPALTSWGNQLSGLDLNPDFVRATKVRLALVARLRGCLSADGLPFSTDSCFLNVRVGNGLSSGEQLERPVLVVMNPPYKYVRAPESCNWAHGRVSLAALFLNTWLKRVPCGSRIVAILPDVLRTGTRYERWRQLVEKQSVIESAEVVGQFQPWADVDVFILRLLIPNRGRGATKWWTTSVDSRFSGLVSDHFEVRVGPVVPHRDKQTGPMWAFLHARIAPAWKVIKRISERRRYEGRVLRPPFVIIRRTSRPGDSPRAVASLVVGNRKVAVENHLLVLIPRRKSLATCQRLLMALKLKSTNEWLDQRIRCRHLTVKSISEMPFWVG
jgi:hypothetical protein